MIPARFSIEYPERCLRLIEMSEPHARQAGMIGSFSLLIAPSLFLIPYERLKAQNPLSEHAREPEMYRALRGMLRRKFVDAPLWDGHKPGDWMLTRIVQKVDDSEWWRDVDDRHPFSQDAKNYIGAADVDKVIRIIRNALAHGNIIYLNKEGLERHGEKVEYLGFLSRYEETEEQRARAQTYRLLAVLEEEFLRFLKCWAQWLLTHKLDYRVSEAA